MLVLEFILSRGEYCSSARQQKRGWKFICHRSFWGNLETSQINRARNVRINLFPPPTYDLLPNILSKSFTQALKKFWYVDLMDDPISLFLSPPHFAFLAPCPRKSWRWSPQRRRSRGSRRLSWSALIFPWAALNNSFSSSPPSPSCLLDCSCGHSRWTMSLLRRSGTFPVLSALITCR